VLGTSLDLFAGRLSVNSSTDNEFSYRGIYFPYGAAVNLDLSYLELLWRLYLLDRPNMKLAMLVGPRFLSAKMEASSYESSVAGDDFLVLPEVGVLIEARLHKRSILFGLVKYMDLTSRDSGSYTLQVEGGLSYLMPAPNEEYQGWRLTGGVRYLNLQAVRQQGHTDQIAFDIQASGPYLEISRVF
jgi:hypothetical protein